MARLGGVVLQPPELFDGGGLGLIEQAAAFRQEGCELLHQPHHALLVRQFHHGADLRKLLQHGQRAA
jgi:hypothetical protein